MKVRFEPKYVPGDYEFVYWPPRTTTTAQCMAAERNPKLKQNRHGPYRMLRLAPEYLNILQEGIEKFVSINRVTPVARE